ncbi:malate synthase G [Thalassotalea atypica]|uniref:malate synthase G n=1 Tax=Thalassotalea atypica TaxID=2054316 RepID=UPI002573C35E|nr:malate synthase G [Thalassotalea atypica]
MNQRIAIENIQVSPLLYQFVEQEVLPLTSLLSEKFWSDFAEIITDLTPVNQALLAKRESLQVQIDDWHKANSYQVEDLSSYKSFLSSIGYIEPLVSDFEIETAQVDDELAHMAGPQLVVPIMNARFALNAVNARWGSLYDALYGSDIIDENDGAEKAGNYNPVRGNKVIAFAKQFLDDNLPLANGSHADVISYQIIGNDLKATLTDGESTLLKDVDALVGFNGDKNQPTEILCSHHKLNIQLCFDDNPIGRSDRASMSDIKLESALTTIMDCEDSVAAVDAEDKVIAYKNWLGLITGRLTESINKGESSFVRRMAQDKSFKTVSGNSVSVKGRSLMFVRNVGHLMTNNIILDEQGNNVPEGIVDAVITSLIASLDISGKYQGINSRQGSIYIVKPKMHGSEEVAFANTLFARTEQALNLRPNTIKMGIMDEERRTTVNLKNCIHAAKSRVVFINTGFLDRTGDEIHTSMHAGPMARKGDIKLTKWIGAYENNNVDVGLSCGLSGKAQIGKGMWPIPDQMLNMYKTKVAHVKSGANTAWVPSPTAATLHAMHYHQHNVFSLQQAIFEREDALLDDILNIPLATDTNWSEQEISDELDNNAQGILGYVVRWIDQGIGCSKVPDITNVGLMEDRATLRISSQHIANWLMHGICTKDQVMNSMKKMARIVDQQNVHDLTYVAMCDDIDNSIAFSAACDLVFKGDSQPSGYTEPLLHHYRLVKKNS